MIRAVHLNRKLELQTPVETADGAGGNVASWATLGTLWAEIRQGTGRELDQQSLSVASTTSRIIVRAAQVGAPSRPRPEQRFVEGMRVFRILAVSELDSEQRYLVCHAREEVIK